MTQEIHAKEKLMELDSGNRVKKSWLLMVAYLACG
jgi:hypothetical protein